MVELAAPGAVHARDRFQRFPLAAAHQRLRGPLSLDRTGRSPVEVGGPAPARRAGTPAGTDCGAQQQCHRSDSMSGVVQGGWEFVIAAYSITAAILGSYAASVLLRYRAAKRGAAKEPAR